MDFIKSYGGGGDPDIDFILSDKNLFIDHENKSKLQTSNVSKLNSFFDQPHNRSLVCHKEFLSELDAGKVYCKVCRVNMDSVLELSEHFQTKSHEDSIIMLVKSNMPPSLYKNMEFITFYDSNLYCNLCKCNISWSSENPFKTIVDIVAHNESVDHLSKKTTNNPKPLPSLQNNDESLIVLQTLAAVDSMLGDSINLIDYKVQPLFKCKLCKKVIEFEENQAQMLINFSLHLNSEGHKKCYQTYLVLKDFEESHMPKGESRHKFSVVKDRIFCSCFSRSINPSKESLLAHVNEKSDDDLGNVTLGSELSSIILEEPKFITNSILSTPVTEFSERYNDQTESSLFSKAPLQLNGEHNFIHHNTVALNNKYESSNNIVADMGSMMSLSTYGHMEGGSDVYSALNTLVNTDFFVSRVSKYLAKVSNQITCDVCDAVICYSSDEKTLRDSIKHHFIGDKHKNFMEKLTFDEKEIIVQLTFDNPTIQANKHYIKASGKYVHCILCQFSLTLCLDHESLQKKLVTHCLGKYHLEEIGKPYNSVFEARPLSSQSTSTLADDNPVKQPKALAYKRPGLEEKMKNKVGNKEGFVRTNPLSEDGKQPSSDTPAVDRLSLHNDPNAIKILNLVPDLTSKGLYNLLKSFGPLRHFYLSKDLKTGLCKGFCLAHYQTRPAAERAVDALNGLTTKYGTLTVKWAY